MSGAVYRVTATMPNGEVRRTTRVSARAARNVARGFREGREGVGPCNCGHECEHPDDMGRAPASSIVIESAPIGEWTKAPDGPNHTTGTL